MGAGPHHDPIEATVRALSAMTELTCGEGGVTMSFAAAHSDAKGLRAFRYAVNTTPTGCTTKLPKAVS